MSDSEEEIIVKRQNLKSSKLLVSDEDTDIENGVDEANSWPSGKPTPIGENDEHSDGGISSCSDGRRSVRSLVSNKSSQLTRNSRRRSSSSSSRSSRSSSVLSKKSRSRSNSPKTQGSMRSSSSESGKRDETTARSSQRRSSSSLSRSSRSSSVSAKRSRSNSPKTQGSRRSSLSSQKPSQPNSSQGSRSSLARSQSAKSQTSPTNSRKPPTSDSEEDFVVSRKSNPTKLLDSDENNSDNDVSNESPATVIPEGRNASDSEKPESEVPKKKRRKRRVVLRSDDEADERSCVAENSDIADKEGCETENVNLTAKEKRRKKLERLNEQKRGEFAKLAEKEKSRALKEKEPESSKNKNSDQPQVETAPVKPKKFLLLSDDDLSDDSCGRPLTDKEYESDEGKKSDKSTKIKKNVERKPRKKSTKSEDQKIDQDGEKKQRKPRQRASKSDMSLKEPKVPKRKSKKEQEAMLEIKSTTQRMIRQNRISLPYHQPKHRSLDEFLQRRNNAIPSIPLRSSYDISSIARERLMKKEKEIEEFYKSESEHSEEEQTTNVAQNCDTSQKNNEENCPLQNVASDLAYSSNHSENDSLPKHDPAEVNASNESEFPNEAVSTEVESLSTGVPMDEQIDHTPEHNEHPINDDPMTDTVPENTDPNAAVTNSAENVESDSLVNSDLNLHDEVPQKAEEPLAERNDEILADSNEVNEKVENALETIDEASQKVDGRSTESDQKTETGPSKNDEENTPAQDTEDFQLEIQDSCPGEDKTESSIATSTGPPARLDPEIIRQKKMALLSSRSVNLSEPKLENKSDSVLQFEIEGLPEPGGIRSFMEKFARHVTTEKKTKKPPTTMNVTNIQTDSEGGIIDIVQETLTLKTSNDDKSDDERKFLLPGCKYSFFKNAMLKTLISKKTSNWQKYQEEKYRSFETDDGECKTIDEDEEELDDVSEPNFEPYHPEDEPDDEDLVEDDVDVVEKPQRKKNEYLDEEAEVDFDEDENVIDGSAEEADSDYEDYGDDEEKSDDINCDEPEKVNDCSDVDDADSDEDLVNSVFKELEKEESLTKETRVPGKLFKNDVTGADLESRVLRLESCSQLEDFSNTQIFSVCSGKFATQTPLKSAASSQFLTDSPFPDDSQGFNLSMEETNDGLRLSGNKTPNIVSKSSFLSSDESDTEELFNRKRKAIQLEDSDDESEKPNDEVEDLGNEENNDEEEEEGGEDRENFDGELEYDSEEEIIDYKKTVPTEFFDNEAELSESEWGSEDENENDMDHFEKEAGDDDEIDHDRLNEELGRIHMRHLIDDDQKNVRLLQELLLEDGELHSDGQRTRKFQWKSADGEAFLNNFFGDSDDENVMIDDTDPTDDAKKNKNWRQMRREREKFLSQQEKNNGSLLSMEDEENSLLRISNTTKVTTKSAVPEEPTKSTLLKSPNTKFTSNTKPRCGSFLSRGQKLLNRIASNLGECKGNIQGPKNSRNFVFAIKTVEQKEVSSATTENPIEKRKISSKSVMAHKRLKLVDKVIEQNTPLKSGLLAQLALSE